MSTALTLYEIEDNLAALVETLPIVEESGDAEQLLTIFDDLAQASDAALVKRRNTVAFLRHLDMQQEAIGVEISRLRDLQARYAATEDRVKQYVARVIEQTVPEPKRGPRKLESSLGTLSLKAGSPSVVVTDLEELPEEFTRVTVKLSGSQWRVLCIEYRTRNSCEPAVQSVEIEPLKGAIKEAISAGETVPGADIKFGPNTITIR